ncbi:MAG: rhodanese-like domain-containing protein [Chloroflexota bacterium]
MLPGHGAGSLCGKSIGSVLTSTVGYERRSNPALAPRTKDEFVEYATRDLPEQPGNHQRIKQINRRGARPLGEVVARPLSVQEAVRHFRQGAALLDTRSKAAFKTEHIPGAVHLEADDQLSNRISFVLPPDIPVILMIVDESAYRRVVFALARVGYDQVVGYLADNLATWKAMGLPVTSGDVRDIEPLELNDLLQGEARPVMVDVREPWEYTQGHVSGAKSIPLGELARRLKELDPAEPVAVICASGSRSQSAAAILGLQSYETVYNVIGGTFNWMQSGLPLEHGN